MAMKEIIRESGKLGITAAIRVLQLPLRFCKIKEKRILFTSLTGGNYYEYTCNPKYIYEAVKAQTGEQYEIIWALDHPEKYRFLEQQGVTLVKHFTWKTLYYLATSKCIITSGSYLPWVSFRRQQIVIDTWQGGGAYKRLDNGEGSLKHLIEKRNRIAGSHVTAFVTSSEAFTEHVIRGAFGYHGEVLEIGMPRNDMLVNGATSEAAQKVRKIFSIPDDKKVMLYAPTYREQGTYEKLKIGKVLDALEEIDGSSWVCLERMHRYERKSGEENDPRIYAAEEYEEMQELLAAADMLVTDYSSSIWDYSFRNCPIYLFTPDLEEYRKNRGFYLDIDEWQIPYAETEQEFLQKIGQMKKIDWKHRMDLHHAKLKCQETGHAADSVVKYIQENM